MCKISLLRAYQKLDIPLSTLQTLIYSRRIFTLPKSTLLLTQPVSLPNLSRSSEMKARVSTLCAPLDRLLSGGIPRGYVLEISGAPGTPKEILANMTSAMSLSRSLRKIPGLTTNLMELVSYMSIHTLSEVMKFMYNLSSYLRVNPDVALLVINSISFPFQTSPTLTLQVRTSLLDRIKQTFSKVCATSNLTIITTSQLATKLLKTDGTAGNFDTGARGIMVPQLGAYLPSGRSYRVILSRKTRITLRLLHSPATVYQDKGSHVVEEPYVMGGGIISSDDNVFGEWR
ncbi:P-loop containing nucleoside triphosphate hydrolase protein [Armillaria luteobubalina]|uniref:P-loop containing nucleoside triphosphate hydrolase protein n=1 Tax=Armillaria luteobubalina TaxID=153913 RepID=A0AA39Q491_9AGAR|nr:P-loop containing nucleoside triphosphate hydrolase protein [Armillaria luteobubalina]